jgi:hypothetical protein
MNLSPSTSEIWRGLCGLGHLGFVALAAVGDGADLLGRHVDIGRASAR